MYGVVGKFFGLPDCLRDAFTVGFEDRQQVGQVMRVRKVDAMCDQQGLDGFLAGLLCVETQVFELAAGYGDLRFCQVALGAVQPFPWIVGWKAFRRFHRPLGLPGARV